MSGLGRHLPDILAGTGPTARFLDPGTAKNAGRQAADPARLRETQRVVLAHLVAAGSDGLTDFEHILQQTSAGKRRLELQRAGLVEDTGRTRPSPTGTPVKVYRATVLGIYALRGMTDRNAA